MNTTPDAQQPSQLLDYWFNPFHAASTTSNFYVAYDVKKQAFFVFTHVYRDGGAPKDTECFRHALLVHCGTGYRAKKPDNTIVLLHYPKDDNKNHSAPHTGALARNNQLLARVVGILLRQGNTAAKERPQELNAVPINTLDQFNPTEKQRIHEALRSIHTLRQGRAAARRAQHLPGAPNGHGNHGGWTQKQY